MPFASYELVFVVICLHNGFSQICAAVRNNLLKNLGGKDTYFALEPRKLSSGTCVCRGPSGFLFAD